MQCTEGQHTAKGKKASLQLDTKDYTVAVKSPFSSKNQKVY